MRVLAFDPGGTTGWASMVFYQGAGVGGGDHFEWGCGQFGPFKQHRDLFQFLKLQEPDVVIYERFDKRANLGAEFMSIEYIGVIKLHCQRVFQPDIYGQRVFEQSSSQAKGFWTDDKLKKLDLWKPGMKHAMDARRHLLYWMMQNNQLPGSYLEMLR